MSCYHDLKFSEPRVATRLFRLAKVTVAIVIAKKYLLAMELDDQKELVTPLVDKNVDDL